MDIRNSFNNAGKQLKEFNDARKAQQMAQDEARYRRLCDEFGFAENAVTKLCYTASKQQSTEQMSQEEWFQYFVEFSIMLENVRGK